MRSQRTRVHTLASNSESSRGGFTLIELLVVIAIIALLVSILMPSLQKAKRHASIAACATNMRSTLLGHNIYASDHSDWVWNYANGAHNHTNPNDGAYNPALPPNSQDQDHHNWYANDNQWHRDYEGRSRHSYWRGILVMGKYGSARSLGCSAPPPKKDWGLLSQGNDAEGHYSEDILKAPPFVYRGRATGTDYDINLYVGGSIAYGPHGSAPNRMNHRPRPNDPRSMIVLNCQAYSASAKVEWASYSETIYISPHQPNLSVYHTRWELGEGTLGTIVSHNIGFTAGHVLFADSGGLPKKYVDPDTGKISAVANERGVLPYGW
ncbi:MAG: type II secretion system GspH family protein [Phycisphaerae bacterium]|nr:type II secretion system GspH family protein [Phycisphaerae bacterium]